MAEIIFNDCSSGMITNVKSELCPPNSVDLALNIDVDDIYGEARARKGSTLLGTQINGNNNVTGLYQFLNSSGSISKLEAVVAGKIYHYTGGAWVDSGETGTDTKTRFITFLDEIVRLNGSDVAKASTDGVTWGSSSTLDTSNFPTGKFGTVYKDQVIVAGLNSDPDTLYISSVPSAGKISWTTGNRTITINPEDGCYDEQTEILTDKGWKFFKDLDKTEKVMTLNPENNLLEWQKPIEYLEKEYNGKMIKIKSKSIDLFVTPNHQFFVEQEKGKKYGKKTWNREFVRADKIKEKSSRIIKTGNWINNEYNFSNPLNVSIELWVAFLGFWLAEGCVNGSKTSRKIKDGYKIIITSKNYKKEIRKLLNEIGIKFHEYKNGDDGCINFVWSDKKLHTYLSKLGNSYTKYIPEDVKNLPSKYLDILWDWMMLGDGSRDKSGRGRYFTTSEKLANDCQEILLKIGKSGKIKNTNWNNFNGYLISEVRSKYAFFTNSKKSYISNKEYRGKIYCVEVPNHILYIRRNGKPSFCGNSNITALGEISGLLLVWKDKAMYTWNNRSTEADEIIKIGCTSQESVTYCGNVISFFNQQGVWLTNGSYPVLISRPVQKWIDGMSSSYYTEVSSFGDEKYLYVSIGDCTVDGISYTNVVLKYSVNTKEWRVYSYPDEFVIFTSYKDTSYKIVAGTDNSKVIQIDSTSLNDYGTDIRFDLQSQDILFGSRGTQKEITERVMAYAENAQGLVQVKPDKADWIPLGTIDKEVNNLDIKEAINGNKFKFRIVGISKNRARIQGLEIPNITGKDYN